MVAKLKKLPKKNWEFSLVFLDKKKMRELNQKHRNQDYVPNVLSFGGDLNEILIRWPLAKGERLEELIAHGVLSLLEMEK